MRIIGIDPGIRSTGYGVIEVTGRYPGLVDYGIMTPPTDAPMAARLGALYQDLAQLIELLNPDDMAIEAAFHGVNAKSTLILGQARGAALVCSAQYKLTCYEYAPRKVKMAVTGNGRATKEQVQSMVQRILNMDQLPAPLDASDALAVALCHQQQFQPVLANR
ncbi:crossover junction endodeoxyribonuclease RuvC [Candidatus Neomarinimicrobiota bacterium]